MKVDDRDVLYIILLTLCIAFGYFYQKLSNVGQKKVIGTTFGLFMCILVSGYHILHVFLTTTVCSLIILSNQRRCHTMCFFFMFAYLLFFRTCQYFSIPEPPPHTNLIQMILTLKLVGLAFEVNATHQKAKQLAKLEKDKPDEVTATMRLQSSEEALLKLSLVDIVHYSFNYIGVLTGPYFTYRCFDDYFRLNYSKKADCFAATLRRLKWVPLYMVLFLTASFIWPLKYATSDEFFNERSFMYRLWYVWPSFFIFRMRIYIGLMLSECACTMAGLGAYPTVLGPRCGSGPSKSFSEVTLPDNGDYDFETIRNVYIYDTETCWTFREAMKKWNTCVQYWLAMYVYKRFPSKQLRTFATLAVSAYWHGVHPGYYFCILGAPFYVPIEDLYNKLYRNKATGMKRKVMDVICWINKFFAFSYLGIAFLLQTIDKIIQYYGSVYYCGYVFWLGLYLVGIMISMGRGRRVVAHTNGTRAE